MSVKSLVRSTVLLGSTQAAGTLVSMLRVKALALMIGPAGLGVLGTLAGVAGVATTLFAVGADTSGTRRLALDRDNAVHVARVRRLLAAFALVHGLVAAGVIWLLRAPLSRWAFGSEAFAGEIAWLGLAVGLSLVAGLQIAVLQGLGRVGDIARVTLASSLVGTVAGLAAVWAWGVAGLVVLLIAQPLTAAVLAARAAPAMPAIEHDPHGIKRLGWGWLGMLREGTAFMLSYLMLAFAPLAVRALVIREYGLDAAGHFHAAWTMSVIYVGFLLNAMSADYFPRLTGLIHERERAIALINDQAQVGLAFGGMLMLVMLAGAPLIVPLLYSPAFAPAAGIIAWQALGNVMKLAGWPVAFLSMARGRSGQFMALEVAWTSLYLGLVWLGLPALGLAVTGMAFAAACVVFLVLQTVVARVTFGFRWRRGTLLMIAGYCAAAGATLVASHHSATLQAVVGGVAALVLGGVSMKLIANRVGLEGGPFGVLAGLAARLKARRVGRTVAQS